MSSVLRVWSWGVIALASCASLAVAACGAFGEASSEEAQAPGEARNDPDATPGTNDAGEFDAASDAADATIDTELPPGTSPCVDTNHFFCAGFDGPELLENGPWPWSTNLHAAPNELSLDATNRTSGASSLRVSTFPSSKQSYMKYVAVEDKLRVTLQLRVTPSSSPDDAVTGTADVLVFRYRTKNSMTDSAYVGLYVTPIGEVGLKWGDDNVNGGAPQIHDLSANWDAFHEIRLDLDLGNGTLQPSVDSEAPSGLYSIPLDAEKVVSLLVGLYNTNSAATFSANIDDIVIEKL